MSGGRTGSRSRAVPRRRSIGRRRSVRRSCARRAAATRVFAAKSSRCWPRTSTPTASSTRAPTGRSRSRLETDANPADVRPGGRLGAFEILDADRRGRDGARSIAPATRGSIASSRSKCCRREIADDPRSRERFDREARVVSQADAPAHLHAVRPGARAGRGRRDAIPGHGAARGRDARGAARARAAADRADASASPRRSPTRSRPRTPSASSTATSSPPTSC